MLTVHVGLHKTGSTSIQVALRRALKASAVVPCEGDRQDDEAVFERLTRAAGNVSVISSESLLGSPFDGYARAPERVRLLSDALSGTPYTLVVYLRPQLQWLESVYIQYVQGGGTETSENFVAEILASPYVRWSTLLNILQTESGAERLIARAYLSDRDVVEDFFSVAALGKPPSSRRSPRLNASLTVSQVPLMRIVNEVQSLSRAQRQSIRGVLQSMPPVTSNNSSIMPEGLQQQIIQAFREDWISLIEMPPCTTDAAHFNRGDYIVRPYAGFRVEGATVRDELARVLLGLAECRMRRRRSLRAMLTR